jgi:biotin-[acetyl-CoA-carboxylase] ligase BirA-like protein
MEIIVLKQCDSTQDYLLNKLSQSTQLDQHYLVITQNQTRGRGQRNRFWHFFPNALAISLNRSLNPTLTLSTLEVGTWICDFFKQKGLDLYLKWPNDLFNQQKQKVGGCILDVIDNGKKAVFGIGLNLMAPANSDQIDPSIFEHRPGFIYPKHQDSPTLALSYAKELGQYLHRRKHEQPYQVIKAWESYCLHLNQEVLITDDDGTHWKGIFKGIDQFGRAEIVDSESNRIKTLVTSRLAIT